MFKFSIIPALLFANFIFSQTNFKLENFQIVWEKVYEKADTGKEDISTFIQSEILVFNPQNINVTPDRISFKIDDDKLNLIKLGRKPMSTPMQCTRNFDYVIFIDLKDNKYRVSITSLVIDDKESNGNLSGSFEELFTKKSGSEFRTGSGVKDALNLFDRHFKEKYSFTTTLNDNSKW